MPSKNLILFLSLCALALTGCNKLNQGVTSSNISTATISASTTASTTASTPVTTVAPSTVGTPLATTTTKPTATNSIKTTSTTTPKATVKPNSTPISNPTAGSSGEAIQVISIPESLTVLVNKIMRLPTNYKPTDLVEPKVAFIFSENSEKRLMRKEAADALEALFSSANKQGVSLGAVSGYRSFETQKQLYASYVKAQGEVEARKYSAVAGHSEHQTGLAMDVSGSNGKCAASDCFAGTAEAKWLEINASQYGFIIRYPKGKEAITGYNYEPWHIRYVGIPLAKEISAKGITLEEYMKNTIPVVR